MKIKVRVGWRFFFGQFGQKIVLFLLNYLVVGAGALGAGGYRVERVYQIGCFSWIGDAPLKADVTADMYQAIELKCISQTLALTLDHCWRV